jgi:AmmeMemoRadiSam system protein A
VLEPTTRQWLLARARAALTEAVGATPEPLPYMPEGPALHEPGRVFVSWHAGERLVGCIGSLEPRLSLHEAVAHFAVQSGLHDPRTPGATVEDLAELRCEISVLSVAMEIEPVGLGSIAAALVPGRDGVVLRAGLRKAVFLPVVWTKLRTPMDFLEALCHKAGIDPVRDGDDVRAAVFTTETFEE